MFYGDEEAPFVIAWERFYEFLRVKLSSAL